MNHPNNKKKGKTNCVSSSLVIVPRFAKLFCAEPGLGICTLAVKGKQQNEPPHTVHEKKKSGMVIAEKEKGWIHGKCREDHQVSFPTCQLRALDV